MAKMHSHKLCLTKCDYKQLIPIGYKLIIIINFKLLMYHNLIG